MCPGVFCLKRLKKGTASAGSWKSTLLPPKPAVTRYGHCYDALRVSFRLSLRSCAIILALACLLGGCLVPPGGRPPQSGPEAVASSLGIQGEWQAGRLAVHFLDVGQGDAILVQLPSGETMLIDGGTREAGPRVVSYLRQQGIKRVDMLLVSHAHEDHLGGLPLVISSFPVGRAYLSPGEHTTTAYADLLEALVAKKVPTESGKAGQEVFRGSWSGPPPNPPGRGVAEVVGMLVGPTRDYAEQNDSSLVLRLSYGQVAFLFTGDAGIDAEEDMLASGNNLQADVLKIAHHGSSHSTSFRFIRRVRPRVAVVSVGADNPFGHPAPSVLRRLQKGGVTVYRTDRDGDILALTDAQYLQVKAGTHATTR